jgi:misacylated tRNA(Ala) deacylase
LTIKFARLHSLMVPRLGTHLTLICDQITQASSILSRAAAQVPDQVSQVVDERKSSEKRVADLASQLVLIVAKGFLPSAIRANEERTSAHVHRNDDPLVFLTTSIASEFVNLYTASDYASKQYPVVFIPSPTSHTATSTTPVLVFGSEDVRVKGAEETLKLKIGVEGGGKDPQWRGKWVGVQRPAKEGETVSEAAIGIPV